jgi:two-component system phosphate regulon sensor histidine kinase PhoR
MEGDDAPQRTSSAPSDLFAALSAIELAISQETIGDEPGISDAVLTKVAQAVGATHAAFWYLSTDGTCALDGAERLPALLQARAQTLAHQAIAHQRSYFSTKRGVGTLEVVPVQVEAACGVLGLVCPVGQRLSKATRAAAIYITQRLMTLFGREMALRDERAASYHWRAIFNALPEAMVIRDAKQRVLDYNDAALALAANAATIQTARQHNRRAPQPVWDTAWPNGTELAASDVPSARAVSEGTPIMAVQLRLKPPTGEAIPVLVTAVPLNSSDGALNRTVAVLHDISPAKRIEQMKDTFAQRVRHDVNQPLCSIKMAAQVIARKCAQATEREGDAAFLQSLCSYTDTIVQATDTIESVTVDLSDLDAVIFGAPTRMSLTDFLRERIQHFKTRYRDHMFICEYDSSDTLLEGYWCKPHIESIVNNLLENAVKYSPKQTTVRVRLFADTYGERRMAHMVVQDEGYGIATAQQEAIFEKKVRLLQRDEAGNVIPGTGEGLHYVKVFAMMYGGSPWVRSRANGSEFHVRLPLAE